MKTVAVINQKGGVGKTTTTVNLGAAVARLGRNVLLLDLDPQSNLTLHIDQRPDFEAGSMTQLLVEDRPLRELIRPTRTPNLYAIPADASLGGVEQVLANRIGRETILREAFEAYESAIGPSDVAFDYVLIDCPPSLGVLSANALVAADEVLIPMQTEYFSLQGMAELTKVIQLVRRRLNPEIDVLCVLPCMVDLRTRLTSEVLEHIEGHFGDRLARTLIRSNVKLAEAPSFGLTIFEHAPGSNGADDYWDFASEFLERHGEGVTEAELDAAADRAVAELESDPAGEPAPDAAATAAEEPTHGSVAGDGSAAGESRGVEESDGASEGEPRVDAARVEPRRESGADPLPAERAAPADGTGPW